MIIETKTKAVWSAGCAYVILSLAACSSGNPAPAPSPQGTAADGADASAPANPATDASLSISAQTPDASAAPLADATSPTPDASAPSRPTTSCAGLPMQAQGDSTWTIPTTTSGMRSALVHIPPGYDPTKATPVVLNFHGLSESPVLEEGLTLMDAEADSQGFVVIYPQGTGTLPSWNAGACCGDAVTNDVDDVGFVGALLDQAEAELCVDTQRIFATGMSNGGFFSHVLGCELSSRIAAIAPVAGVMGIPTCNPSRPVPIIEFHGTSDLLVPYNGNPVIGYTSVPDTIAGWVQRDGCLGQPMTTYSNGDATCVTYGQCNAGAEVTLCTITGGGHTWPGGTPFPLLGVTSTDISATDAMWTFFQKHPM